MKLSDNKRYKGMMDALVKTYKFEGIAGLYKGFVPGKNVLLLLFNTKHFFFLIFNVLV